MLLAAWVRDKKILPTQTITIINLPKFLFQIEKQTISLCKQGNIEATLACWQHCRARGWTSAERSRKFCPENILFHFYHMNRFNFRSLMTLWENVEMIILFLNKPFEIIEVCGRKRDIKNYVEIVS